MAAAKLVVVYPRPLDITAFEDVYVTEHVPMANKYLVGATKTASPKYRGRLMARSPLSIA